MGKSINPIEAWAASMDESRKLEWPWVNRFVNDNILYHALAD